MFLQYNGHFNIFSRKKYSFSAFLNGQWVIFPSEYCIYLSKFYPKNILIFMWRNELKIFRTKIGSHNHIPLIVFLSASFHLISTFIHYKQFSIYIFPRKWQISPQISTKYFQNRIIMFCLELWYIQLSAYRKTYFQTELWNCSSTGDSYF